MHTGWNNRSGAPVEFDEDIYMERKGLWNPRDLRRLPMRLGEALEPCPSSQRWPFPEVEEGIINAIIDEELRVGFRVRFLPKVKYWGRWSAPLRSGGESFPDWRWMCPLHWKRLCQPLRRPPGLPFSCTLCKRTGMVEDECFNRSRKLQTTSKLTRKNTVPLLVRSVCLLW